MIFQQTLTFSLWNRLIVRRIIDYSVSASYYYSLLEFDIRYTSYVIRYSLHEYTGISQLKSSCCSLRCTQCCAYLNWVNGKLHTKVNTVEKQLTCLAPFASALPFLSLAFFRLSFSLPTLTECTADACAICAKCEALCSGHAAIVARHIHLAPFSVLFRCLSAAGVRVRA